MVIEKQYKPAIKTFTYTLPKGAIEKGETSLSAAKENFWKKQDLKQKNGKKLEV